MKKNKGVVLYNKAKKLIPGGTQLLSKRPERFLPELWPSYYNRCKGVNVWDLDNNRLIDISISGVGTCVLGYADSDVDRAVKDAIKSGTMCTLNCPEEVELANLLCELHPWAKKVRYARTGGEAAAIAIRIARAATGKEKVLFCGYHGWHDWYLSANLAESTALDGQLLPGLKPKGVPRSLQGTSIPFHYNDLDSFKSLVNKYSGNLAAVIMEPVRIHKIDNHFLDGIRRITKKENIPLIFDEITTGFRMTTGGVHLTLGIEPDIAVFAKAISNGYPMAAVIGKSNIMDAAQDTFISSTYWTDRIGPAAALATLRKHKKYNVSKHLIGIGNRMQRGWKDLSKKYALDIDITGMPPLSYWSIKLDDSQLIHTFIVKEMLKRGFLTSVGFYATYAHTPRHIDSYINALDDILRKSITHIKDGRIRKLYTGQPGHTGFRRLA